MDELKGTYRINSKKEVDKQNWTDHVYQMKLKKREIGRMTHQMRRVLLEQGFDVLKVFFFFWINMNFLELFLFIVFMSFWLFCVCGDLSSLVYI